ncbi:hypothetical protein TNCT_31391 [Trichonephila clavata]|uniref:Uncharacterized protein n=1 Tax=Trichonephila clavata TaxID=2740835 RepID=A0A8X6G754_TRICU|nr:hypothetical protein TNCT_31391 [Trichonephila clavata]
MALQQREICKVGESPSARRRSLSPRRGSGPSSNEENPDQSRIEPPSDVPKSSKLSSPSSQRLKCVPLPKANVEYQLDFLCKRVRRQSTRNRISLPNMQLGRVPSFSAEVWLLESS